MTEQAKRVRCKRCKKVKVRSSFSSDTSRPEGIFPWCKACQAEYGTENKFQDSEAKLNGKLCPLCDTPIRGHANRVFCSNTCKNRVAALRKNFGLTVAQYRELVTQAKGKCPICLRKVTQWHVDHNHKTREITGVVCSACNVGALAYTYHDVEYLQRLSEYLNNTPATRLGIHVLAPEGANKPSSIHSIWQRRSKKGTE